MSSPPDPPKHAATQAMSAVEAAEVMAASAKAAPAAPPEPAAAALALGSRVRTSHAGSWYSGSVIASRDGQCEVEWDSGQKSVIPLASLEREPEYPGSHPAGTRVLAQWSDGGFYPATVQIFNGTSYRVSFENGTTSWLSPGQIRLA